MIIANPDRVIFGIVITLTRLFHHLNKLKRKLFHTNSSTEESTIVQNIMNGGVISLPL